MFIVVQKDISSDDDLKTDSHQHITVVSSERTVVLMENEIVMESDNVPGAFMMFL